MNNVVSIFVGFFSCCYLWALYLEIKDNYEEKKSKRIY